MIVTEEFKKGVSTFSFYLWYLIERLKVPTLWIESSSGLQAGLNFLRSTTSSTSIDITCKLLRPLATRSSKSNGK